VVPSHRLINARQLRNQDIGKSRLAIYELDTGVRCMYGAQRSISQVSASGVK